MRAVQLPGPRRMPGPGRADVRRDHILTAPYFENNRTYVGCLWLLAGLQVTDKAPWPLRLQVVILYFGAGLNKLLDPDWRSGQFFENMIAVFGRLQSYGRFSSLLPHLWLSRSLGWTVITVEFVVAGGFLCPPLWGPTAWIGIAYHTALMVTAGKTFGMFYFATLSSFLVFVRWPLPSLRMSLAGESFWARRILDWLRKLDFDGLFVFAERADELNRHEGRNTPFTALRMSVGDNSYVGFAALYMALVYSPITYFTFAAIVSPPFSRFGIFRLILSLLFVCFMARLFSPGFQGISSGTAFNNALGHSRELSRPPPSDRFCGRPSMVQRVVLDYQRMQFGMFE
jgi:hypothetical protein